MQKKQSDHLQSTNKQQPKQTHNKTQSTINLSFIDIQNLFKLQSIHSYLIEQINSILHLCQSVIVIYQKLFIKFKLSNHSQQSNLYMIKINKSYPLDNSIRLYLLDGPYQPQIFDTRDLLHQVLGKVWHYNITLEQIVSKLPSFQQKMSKRNQNYLELQKTGTFLLSDVFVYNQLEQHTSLSLFIDKSQSSINIINALSQTHLITFQKVIKKTYKSKQQEDYQMKSKTLYGKKFMLSKYCDLQCIQSMQINNQTKQISLNILKYRSIKSFSDYASTTKKISFNNDQQSFKLFIRIILKNLPKYQTTKLSFLPSYDKSQPQTKQDLSIQKALQLNQIQQKLQNLSTNGSKTQIDTTKKEQLINKLNKSYQKMIQYYSARANPYYLIYVNKLNWLYNKYFVQQKQKTNLATKSSYDQSVPHQQNKTNKSQSSKLIKSLTVQY